MIKVRLSSLLESVGDGGELELDFRGDIGALIKELVRRYPGLGEEILTPQGELEYHILVSVNARAISTLQGLETEVRDGDQVDLHLILGGG
ncbi:MAG: MoaD/ThiS family protein [Candidatus Bipolaricaulia bacterium]